MQTLDLQNLSVQGERILVQLKPFETIKSESGILIPKYDNYVTDGGKPASSVTHDKYSSVATIIQIAPAAQTLLDDLKITLKPGDLVALYKNALNDNNWFILDRSRPVAAHEGYLLIHPTYIQALIHNS